MTHGHPRQAALIAYLAGIIDGEGSLRIVRNISKDSLSRRRAKNPEYHAQIMVGMVTKEVIDLLCETFDGHVREERVPNRRSIYRWVLTGRPRVMATIDLLYPYFIVKKRHAEVVYRFCAEWQTPYCMQDGISESELQRREEAYQMMRKLNAVGAAATTERVGTREGEATV